MEVTIQCIRVGMLGTNCYILSLPGRDDCVVIDPGAGVDRIRRAMEGKKLAAILLTHGHFDHIGAVDALMEADTRLYIHREDAPKLQDPALNVSWMLGGNMMVAAKPVTVDEGDCIQEAGITLSVIHTPGHTSGCVCYLCGDVVFTGDTLMAMGPGRTDLPTGSEAEIMDSLEKLRRYTSGKQILGGHG